MSAFDDLAPRLDQGRPLLLGGDVRASLRARGVTLDAALGKAVREQADLTDSHYEVEVRSGADVVSTLTAETTPRALATSGMAFRAAALTARTVDRALEIAERAGRPVAVAGVIDGRGATPDRWEEVATHAARLAAAGVHLAMIRGFEDEPSLAFAVQAARSCLLPVWVVLDAGSVLTKSAPTFAALGVSLVLLRSSAVGPLSDAVAALRATAPSVRLGALLDASEASEEGTPSDRPPEVWADHAIALTSLDVRAIGGGRGSTHAHTAALSASLRRTIPSMIPTSA